MFPEPKNMVTPRKAVACVLLRDQGEVLLGRRNDAMRFMPGHHVFPGGRIDDDESARHVVDAEDEVHARTIHAASREVFEESGILCVEGTLPHADTIHQARLKMLEGTVAFDDILEQENLVIPASRFAPAGAWMTPGNNPIRFDTRYYLFEHDDSHAERLIEGEMTSLDWLEPQDARRRWQTGDLSMPAPVSYTLQHLAALPLPESLEMLQTRTDRHPGVPTRVEWKRGINWIPLLSETIPPATHTNCIVIGERELYVIDPGASAEDERDFLYTQIDHMIALGGRVKAVILSHSHIDHVAGAPQLAQRYEAPVWAHDAAAQEVEFEVDHHIRDDDLIPVEGDPGWRLRALHTPGHDPGHLAFIEETTGSLIAGDMVANPGTIIVSRSFNGDMADFMASLHRLAELDTDVLLPAHGHPIWESRDYLEENIRHRQWREDKVSAILEEGVSDFPTLLQRSYDDVPPEAMPLAEHSLDAILHKLGVDIPR